MKTIVIREAGAPDVLTLTDVPQPEPQAGEVLIKVAAAAVNRPDVFQRMGLYPPPKGASNIPGLEVAGEIVAAGEGVTRWAKGDKVAALTAGGGYAEYALAHEGSCVSVPKGLSMNEAACIPETFMTVWHNVFERGALKPGESFLVHGGSGGQFNSRRISVHACLQRRAATRNAPFAKASAQTAPSITKPRLLRQK